MFKLLNSVSKKKKNNNFFTYKSTILEPNVEIKGIVKVIPWENSRQNQKAKFGPEHSLCLELVLSRVFLFRSLWKSFL